MNTEATLAAEPVIETENEVKATETAEVVPEPAQETEVDREAKKAAKLEARFARLTREKYELKAELDAVKRYAQPQTQSESEPEGDDVVARVREEVSREFEERQQQKVVNSVFKQAKISRQEFVDELPDFTKAETAMAVAAIMDSELAPKLVQHLYNNPEEAERIACLSPAAQAREIGKLEVKLSSPAPIKKSGAPAPIKPITGNKPSTSGYYEGMTQAEYEAWRNSTSKRR